MSKRILLIALLVAGLYVLFTSPLMAQSQQDAIRLHREAYALQEKTRSKEDLKKAVEKYEEALIIYRKVGDTKKR